MDYDTKRWNESESLIAQCQVLNLVSNESYGKVMWIDEQKGLLNRLNPYEVIEFRIIKIIQPNGVESIIRADGYGPKKQIEASYAY